MKENLFYELNITEDGYVIGRHNHDEADSVSIIGYTEESKHARLFVAAPELLEALQMALEWIDAVPSNTLLPAMPGFDRDEVNSIIAKATGETK